MAVLNNELLNRLNTLKPQNKELLKEFLLRINRAQTSAERTDAVAQLRARIREYVAEEMKN
ncbi:hypothetical protein [Lysinibacillus halotolerans]|uniref:Uncharacterized protein n=1 Tax=Lysinibacillus halotolerans TaxID=1368476 RepID=A0A3M8HAX0_9BACI|nr:hypothetical protein [Lysinibacillus halotolerans]RNC99551.1 hypothetical protein EC501_07325 [Lysinibacillus halotolerans]